MPRRTFPVAGIDLTRAYCDQSPRPLPQGQWTSSGQTTVVPGIGVEATPDDVYGRTCAVAVNVRGFEATTQRRRGGTRPGWSKHISTAVGNIDGWLVQELARIVWSGGTVAQQSQSGRIVVLVAFSQGYPYTARAGDLVWTPANNATGNSPPNNFVGVIFSASNSQKLWIVDGAQYTVYDPAVNTISNWIASDGALPVDGDNNTARLICNWRGRICLAGFLKASQQLWMSTVDDPTDWNTNQLNSPSTQAFATTIGPQGGIGMPITALIPFTDDVLVVGLDHEIWIFNGDPQAGGQLSKLTDSIGILFGEAWCQDPYGTIYFASNLCSIYQMQPGSQPVRLSQQIEQLLQTIDTGFNSVRLLWDDRFQGLFVFVTPLEAPGDTTHFFWEARTGSWFLVKFANQDMNPIAVCDFDGNSSDDRTILAGGWDGYVRQQDVDAPDDDGTPIVSRVMIGPILSKTFDEMRVDELVADLGEASGAVRYDVYIGTTAEAALSSASVKNGTLGSGRSNAQVIRRAAHAMYLGLSSSVRWAMERIRLRVTTIGPSGPRPRSR